MNQLNIITHAHLQIRGNSKSILWKFIRDWDSNKNGMAFFNVINDENFNFKPVAVRTVSYDNINSIMNVKFSFQLSRTSLVVSWLKQVCIKYDFNIEMASYNVCRYEAYYIDKKSAELSYMAERGDGSDCFDYVRCIYSPYNEFLTTDDLCEELMEFYLLPRSSYKKLSRYVSRYLNAELNEDEQADFTQYVMGDTTTEIINTYRVLFEYNE